MAYPPNAYTGSSYPSAPPAPGGYPAYPMQSGPPPSYPGYGYAQAPPPQGPPQPFQSRASIAARAHMDGASHGKPCSKVVLRIGCRDLIKLDTFSESDPLCIVYGLDTRNQWHEIGRTERIKNSKNPNFSKSFTMNYYFEEKQSLKFCVWDSDKEGHASLDKHDFIGEVVTSLGSIVGAAAGNFTRPLSLDGGTKSKKSTKKNRGLIHITAEEDPTAHSQGEVHLQFRGTGLDKKDFFGKSDPYLEIWRATSGGTQVLVHKTETIMKTLNPTWKKFTLPLSHLTGGSPASSITFKVYDWDSDGSHDFIGGATVTAGELASGKEFDLINPKKMPGGKKHKRGYRNSGLLHLTQYNIVQTASFLDFLHGGLELSFNIAIDFTGSNGQPSLPTSLHYMNPHEPNQYASAITAIGNIIADYDNDQMFPCHGYGAKINGQVSHCFPLIPGRDELHGIGEVIGAYHQTIQHVQLWGPTNFSPVIHHTISMAENATLGTHYFVLLIITDGVITDRDQTIDAIVKASALPMSIIIIGVGNADFSDMEMLDGDEHVLKSSRGEPARRDIVQFVPYRNFHNNGVLLAKEVLAELPDQVVQYYAQAKYTPKNFGITNR